MTRTTAVCTIAAKNYLPFVRVLMESVRRHHPEFQRVLILTDRVDGYFDPTLETFEVIESAQLPIADSKWFHFKYTLLELSTAVKPYALTYLIQRYGLERVIYLDPDIKMYHPLDGVMEALEKHQAVLTPHITAPLADDRLPGDLEILRAGAYNLGFLGLATSPEILDFLKWWQGRLYDHCIADFSRGLFVDQRWMDLAPSLLDKVKILREPGYNVAYWNLAHRQLRTDKGRVLVNESPLYFFHFSGLNPEHPEELSRHQDRYQLADLGETQHLALSYAEEVRAHGYATCKGWPYAYGFAVDGTRIPDISREVARDQPDARAGVDDPFSVEGLKKLDEAGTWADPQGGLSLLAKRIYAKRPDLQQRFPDVEGRDRLAFLTWLFTHGKSEHELDESQLIPLRQQWSHLVAGLPGLLPRVSAYGALLKSSATQKASVARKILAQPTRVKQPAPRRLGKPSAPFGLNVAGYLNAKTGVGQAARNMITAARAAGLNPHLTDVNAPDPDAKMPYAFSLFQVNADQTPVVMSQLGRTLDSTSYRIGYWFWELEEFPDQWLSSFEHCDEIWVASSFCQAAIGRKSPRPVVKIPPPIIPAEIQTMDRGKFGIPAEPFVFLNVFDLKSGFERKNPLATVRAFCKAFGDSSSAFLVLKAMGDSQGTSRMEALREAVDGNPNIQIIHRELAASELQALFQCADCLMSLHRSEGFGLPLAEAMLLGKPVICTAYSGNMDFTHASTAFLVDFQMTTVGQGSAPYDPSSVWADPSVDHAASLMRTVLENAALREKIARAGQRYIETNYSPAAIGRLIRDRLDRIKTFRN